MQLGLATRDTIDQGGMSTMFCRRPSCRHIIVLDNINTFINFDLHQIIIMDQELAQQMTLCESAINQIEALLSSNPSNWRSCLEVARSIIAALDGSELLSRTSLLDEQLKLARTLQKLAYQDPDSGGEADIASWCVRQWATMLQRHPDTIEILKGMLKYDSSIVISYLYGLHLPLALL